MRKAHDSDNSDNSDDDGQPVAKKQRVGPSAD